MPSPPISGGLFLSPNPSMNPTIQPSTDPIRCGDKVQTLPVSGDTLTGRVNAVFDQGRFFRVKFPIVSPYFREGDGVIYRAHEITRHVEAPEPVVKTKLPNRPKPTRTS